jgi:rhodanese-related sulfurtransferase
MLKKKKKVIESCVFILISMILMISTLSCDSSTKTTVEDANIISVEEAYNMMQDNQDNPDFMIIDVRTESEYILGHIENAVNIDYYAEDFKQTINQLDKNKTYIVYCGCGGRGGKTLNIMKELGFREVYNIKDGFLDWQFEKLPYVE